MMKTLNKIIFLLTMLITFSAGTAYGQDNLQDSLYVKPIEIEPETSATLEFSLYNTNAYYGFQANVKLPNGLKFVTNEQGKPIVKLDLARLDGGDYQLVTNLKDGVLHVAAFSASNPQQPIIEGNGTIFTVEVEASDDFRPGYVNISDIRCTNTEDKDVKLKVANSFVGVLPTSVELNKDFITFDAPGETETLTATVFPDYSTDKTLTWTSTNEEIAIVDQDGRVTAIKRGHTTVVVTTVNGYDAVCDVVVGQPATDIEIYPTEKSLMVGEGIQISATVKPEGDAEDGGAVDQSVRWTSDDTEVATVDENGYVTAVSLGTATITAIANGGDKIEATCLITVIPTPAQSVTINPAEVELKVGGTQKLSAEVLPAETTDKAVKWSSSDESIAMVDEDTGIVTAIALGEATIYAKCGEATGSCLVKVVPTPAEGITISNTEMEIYVGDERTLTAVVYPADATDQRKEWSTSDESIVTVTQEGEIVAISPGVVVITVECQGLQATCKVTVLPIEVDGISIDPEILNMIYGDPAYKLTTTFNPTNATYQTLEWTTSDENVAIVSENGEVTAVGSGTATINATTYNGLRASCQVNVTVLVTNLTIDRSEAELKIGDKLSLTATVEPDNASEKTVTWTSSDERIATVDNNGNVTALALGETTITAKCGDFTAICEVTVVPIPVTGIALTSYKLDMTEGEESNLLAIVKPSDATDQRMTWSINHPDNEEGVIALIIVDGEEIGGELVEGEAADGKVIVKALKTGKAIITVTSVSSPDIKAECEVTVTPNIILVDAVNITNQSPLIIGENDKVQLTATITPENASNQSLSWTSKDATVANVTDSGEVTGISSGSTSILASSPNGPYASCDVYVVRLTLSQSELLMSEDKETDLIAILRPTDVPEQGVEWASSDESVATVEIRDGIVYIKALKTGNATITATYAYLPSVKATCEVTVTPGFIPVEEIILDESLEMTEKETYQLTAQILPDNATDKTVTWLSEDNAIATVAEDGTVTAVHEGKTRIVASASNGLSAYCEVTVKKGFVPVTGVSLSNTELLLTEGFTTDLLAFVRPSDATDQRVTWETSDENIVTFSTVEVNSSEGEENEGENPDSKVIVNAITSGTATITVTSVSNPDAKAQCVVTVVPPVIAVESISIKDALEMTVGDSEQLIATLTPEDATDKNVTWSSTDPAIATVAEDGVVTAVSVGNVNIIASTSNGKQAICNVTVKPGIVPVESLTLTTSDLLMRVGKTAEISAIVNPSDATYPEVEWKSNDESIATLSVEDGKVIVTALKEGVTTLTVTSVKYPEVSAVCNVTVSIIPVESIKINDVVDNKLELALGTSRALTATVLPEDATDKTVTWKSSNPAVVSITAEGVVTAVSGGTAIIYASSSNGLTDECEITVPVPVTEITLTQSELLMREGHQTELSAIIKPENATDKRVIWTSSNPEIVSIDENGVVTTTLNKIVTANKVGAATIIVRAASNQEILDECLVTVVPAIIAVEKIELNRESLVLEPGNDFNLIATITPDDATDKTVTWRSSNPEVATVDDNGHVIAVSGGAATIYASSSNGLTAECAVTVPVPVTGIAISQSELLMRVGKSSDLFAIIKPDNASDKSVIWSSSDEDIAIVDENGKVTALKVGEAIITATSGANNSIKDICHVRVEEVADIIAVTGIAIEPTAIEKQIGETHQLTATITPVNATDKTVTWKSSDPTIATVDENGLVTAVGGGSATIYASSSNGLTAECVVTVPVPVTGIALSNSKLLMRVGKTADLIAIVKPFNATDQSLTWTSSDESIATVTIVDPETGDVIEGENADGKIIVTAIKEGVALITATSANGVKAICEVTVSIIPVESIALDKTYYEFKKGETNLTLTATVLPEDATDKSVTWRSSNPAVATVSDSGVVTAVSGGTATIYASSSNGLTAECVVTIPVPVTEITLSQSELLMREGYSSELIAIIKPDNATDKRVIWESSDPDIVKVDENGVVTAMLHETINAEHVGQAIITVTSVSNPEVKDECIVTVVPPIIAVEDIRITKDGIEIADNLEMTVGDTEKLDAIVTPDDATDKKVTWSSTNAAIATVSEDGLVTAISEGVVTIIAASSNGKEARCNVTVRPGIVAVESITLTTTDLTMKIGDTAEVTAIVNPSNATNPEVEWRSDDESIATLTVEDGKVVVTALKEGEITLTVSSVEYPTVTAKCKVTVTIIPVESITINDVVNNTIDMAEGDVRALTATVLPEQATDKTVTWKSSDPSIATVSADGEVTAINAGTAIVYASASNGLTVECKVNVYGMSISNTELILREGRTTDLIAVVRPMTEEVRTVTWISDNPEVATVDENGIVTAVKIGTATITATCDPGVKLSASCAVTVIFNTVENITLDKHQIKAYEGENATLKATISPDDASDKTVTWKSSDNTVAIVSVDPDDSSIAVVTAVGAGTATIYASSSNGLTDFCEVTVEKGNAEVPVEGITLSNSNLIMFVGHTAEIIPIISPANATDISITWTSDNEEYASVDANGVVTALKVGSAIITATTANGIEAKCNVTIVPVMVDNISLRRLSDPEPSEDPISLSMKKDEIEKLKAIVTPDNATDKTVTWKSSDTSIATVSPDSNDSSIGIVTAVGTGSATIYATSSNGLTAECSVTVAQGKVTITIVNAPEKLSVGESILLQTKIEPENAKDAKISWISDTPSVATVDENGNVTAIGIGEVTITAKINDAEASCKIQVVPVVPTGITLSNSKLEMRVGDTSELIGIVHPANATDKSIVWTSSDVTTVSVEVKEGKVIVTGNKVGTAVITARTSNGLEAQCEVTVVPVFIPVTKISLDKTVINMAEGYTEQLTAIIEPEDATDKTVTWISLDQSVATVSSDGLVTAVSPGRTTIIASSSNGLQAACEVNVAITIFDDGILIYRVISDTAVEVIGLVDPNADYVAIRTEATYTSPTLTKTFTITTIGEDALKDYDNLKKVVIFNDHIPEIKGNPFAPTTTIYVADPEEYEKNPDWGKIPNTIKSYVTIEAPAEDPKYSPNGSIQIASDIVIKDKPTVWTSSHETIATVDNTGKISMHYVGHTTITATCDGYSDSFVLTVYPYKGDANWDGVINIADPVNIANYVVKKNNELINWNPTPWNTYSSWTREYWDGFYDVSSDINGQEGITVSDASEVVSIILAQSSPAASPRMIAGVESSEEDTDALIPGIAEPIGSKAFSIPVMLEDSKEYVALQADVRVAAPMTIKEIKAGERAARHRLSTRKIDDQTMRIVLFDLNNSAFAEKGQAMFEVIVEGNLESDDDIEIDNIVASDIHSKAYMLIMRPGEVITGVDAAPIDDITIRSITNRLIIGNAKGKQISVFSMGGAIITTFIAETDLETISLTRGIYVVTVDNKTAKFAVK